MWAPRLRRTITAPQDGCHWLRSPPTGDDRLSADEDREWGILSKPTRRSSETRPPPGDRARTASLWVALLSPAVLLPGGEDRFALAKLAALALAVVIGLHARPTGWLPRWAVIGLVAGSVWLVLAASVSEAPWAQLWGRWPRYEGLITLPVLAGALWLGARTLGPDAPKAARITAERAIMMLAALVTGVALLQVLGAPLLQTPAGRPGSLLGNATDQGAVGALCAVVLLVGAIVAGLERAPSLRPLLARLAGIGLAVLGVVLSGSRGALLGLVCGVLVIAGLLTLPSIRSAMGTNPQHRAPGRLAASVVGGTLGTTVLLAPRSQSWPPASRGRARSPRGRYAGGRCCGPRRLSW